MLDRNNVDLPPELRAMNAAMDAVFGTERHAIPAAQFTTQQLAIESAIMKIPGFDYSMAWELSAAIQARLERIYDDRLDPAVKEAFERYRKAIESAEEPEDEERPASNHVMDDDQRADDPRRL